MEKKIRLSEIPSEGSGFWIVTRPDVAEKPVVCVGDLDVNVGFTMAFAFVHDSANLFRADVFIKPTPEKENRRMQIGDFR